MLQDMTDFHISEGPGEESIDYTVVDVDISDVELAASYFLHPDFPQAEWVPDAGGRIARTIKQ